MKFGLEFRNKKLVADYGGIGEYIANSLSSDYFVLKGLLVRIKNQKPNNDEEIRIQGNGYKYLKVKGAVTTACFYDEFEEDGDPEIGMGYLDTTDLIVVIEYYMSFLIEEKPFLVKRIEPIYIKLDTFVKSRNHIIHTFRKHSENAEILLETGKETVAFIYIMKAYHISFKDDEMVLTKNRQYEKDAPFVFRLSDEGCDDLISFLNNDMDAWYAEKMKMYYEGNKLIVVPDEDES